MPDMTFVDSSTIEAIGYDSESRELHIQFVGSGLYVYLDVDQETYDGLLAADSKGGFFNREVRARGFAFEKRG
jgi:hypothetical protein